MRERVYEILDVQDDSSFASKAYNVVNIFIILISVIPLMYKEETNLLLRLDQMTVIFFIVEYFFRLGTADLKFPEKEPAKAFLTYPITPYALVDLLSILPSLTFLSSSLRLLRLLRLTRSLRVFRTFKLFRYSKSMDLLVKTIKKQKDPLLLIAGLVVAYIFIAALLAFNVEHEAFPSFFEAVYWATSTLTTVTYGDIFPVSRIGRTISMISSLVGVIVIALPTSIITAGYVEELNEERELNQSQEEEDS